MLRWAIEAGFFVPYTDRGVPFSLSPVLLCTRYSTLLTPLKSATALKLCMGLEQGGGPWRRVHVSCRKLASLTVKVCPKLINVCEDLTCYSPYTLACEDTYSNSEFSWWIFFILHKYSIQVSPQSFHYSVDHQRNDVNQYKYSYNQCQFPIPQFL